MSKLTFDNTASRDKTDLQCHVEAKKRDLDFAVQEKTLYNILYNDQSIVFNI